MYLLDDPDFKLTLEDLRLMFLKSAKLVDVGEWHSQPVDHPMLVSRELQNTMVVYPVPRTAETLAEEVKANLPWAEDHFQERVCGRPLNPPPSNEWWPFAEKNNARHKADTGAFSHTYPERMWPKHAGDGLRLFTQDDEWEEIVQQRERANKTNRGIRFEYGDLNDVVDQLRDNPETRQAYLPIWFPEDTGAVHGERVPCTLGYHFMIRESQLFCNYYMRSCDFMRHFNDDVYLAARLVQWVCDRLQPDGPRPGLLHMFISSLHVFEGDLAKLKGQA